MMPLPSLDEKCGNNFSFRDFVECGETYTDKQPNNVPKEQETYAALRDLAREIIDPVCDELGNVELTYGVSCRELHKHIKLRISPPLDQHASYELNRAGNRICDRGGAAVDFICLTTNALIVAQWVVRNCAFDRLYFYGSERPIHVSVGPDKSRQIVLMRQAAKTDRRVPRNISTQNFIKLKEDDELVRSCTTRREDAS